jgi:retron-type reverse transcriptase
MKRTGNLIDKIAEPENIRLAFFKAIKGKRDKKDANKFSGHLHYEIPEIHHELLSGDVHWGTYFRFKIYDPKEREICAASFRERVIHHAIINICEPVFEEYQISDSYACRKGKGLDAAIDRAQGCSGKSPWFLKMDIRKYFDSIDHEILKKTIRRKFKDKTLLNLFDQIIDGYFKVPGKGVPIGNLTSQYFANHYLALFDHYIKEELRCSYYIRYMDDFVIWGDSREYLKLIHNQVDIFLKEFLSLELKPECLNRSEKGLTFLGYRIFPRTIKLNRRSRDRFRRKMVQYHGKYESGEWTEDEISRHVEPLLSFVKRADSEGYRRRLLIDMGLCPKERPA